jgi:outer membrane lipoprotein-sorting protein
MRISTISSLSLALLFSASSVFSDEKGDAVAKKYFELKEPQTTSSSAEMIISDKAGSKKSRILKMSGKKDANGTWTFIEFDSPADVKGTRLLNISRNGAESEQRIYLPALKKSRLIASSGKGGKFVGSDFFYYDLDSRKFEDYTYSFLKDDVLEERSCSVIEMKPKDSNSPYAKSEAWVSNEDHFVYQMKLYDKKTDTHIKTMSVVKTLTIDGCIIPTELRMVNYKDNSETQLIVSDLKVNQGVDEKVFSIQYLETR